MDLGLQPLRLRWSWSCLALGDAPMNADEITAEEVQEFLAERSRCDCDGCAERDELRSLIVYWCDIVDDLDGHPSDYHSNVAAAEDELRRAVGR
jgi:hypothetical protein